MRCAGIVVLALSACLVGGCSNLRGAKLLTPEAFGLVPVDERIYIEAGADEKARAELRDAMTRAESAVRAAYGGVQSHPIVHGCITEGCYESFGGMGSRAKVYGDRILLSPRGLSWHFLAHEWSHDEIRSRLTFGAWWGLPRWFDEGLAVAVSEAPEHSEAHWEFLVASDVPRPSRSELHSYRTLRQWLDAVHRYGETANAERRAKGEPEVRPVYAAAGHEVRPWFAEAGRQGLLGLIKRLNEGDDFEDAYPMAATAAEGGVPQAEAPLAAHPSP
ncbi:MAG: hypothetical protein PVF91_10505 [Chromatiales bacterium]|jgi:hypothetical protein